MVHQSWITDSSLIADKFAKRFGNTANLSISLLAAN